MKIESLKEFMRRTKKSRSTIGRFYKRNPEKRAEIIFRKKNYYPIEHARYFDSEIMFDVNKELTQENKTMRNVIECLMDRESMQTRLWYMEWSYFGTVAYKLERNKKSCRRMMQGLFDTLTERYGDQTDIRIFFTTEPFINRNGFHNHFVLFVSNKSLLQTILDEICLYFEYDRSDFKPYNPFKAGLFYMVKNGIHGEDWDILGNNLKAEGEKYQPLDH
ncbi:MAG: hypothetical protein K2P88_01165 [Chitinophagaceae bacterium]|nr:hypothetical protein [Chitinophagaceae bacterium]